MKRDMENNTSVTYSENDSFHAFYDELKKGIQSMKNGGVFTIEETWEEIDKI